MTGTRLFIGRGGKKRHAREAFGSRSEVMTRINRVHDGDITIGRFHHIHVKVDKLARAAGSGHEVARMEAMVGVHRRHVMPA